MLCVKSRSRSVSPEGHFRNPDVSRPKRPPVPPYTTLPDKPYKETIATSDIKVHFKTNIYSIYFVKLFS